jgi:molybdenum cofactor cytidylyltransferase
VVVSDSIGLILLAAGGSSRLGQPKQLLEYKGQPLLRHAAEIALASQCRPVIVVLGAEFESCLKALHDLEVTPVINSAWENGLSSSICAGILALEGSKLPVAGAILSVADQPHLTSALLNSLIERQRATGAKIVASEYAGKPGPPALFAASLFSELKKLSGDEGARRVVMENLPNVSLVSFPQGALDVDTRADYERLQQG